MNERIPDRIVNLLPKGIVELRDSNCRERVIFYNRVNQKRIFTTMSQKGHLCEDHMGELATSPARFTEPKLSTFRAEVTFRCNAACDYCLVYNNSLAQLGMEMSLRTAREIVASFNENVPGGSCMLIGGEPLLNLPVVRYFVEHIKGSVTIFSNGTLIDKNMLTWLAKPNVRVIVSLDGIEQDNSHRKYHSGSSLFDDALRGYELLKASEVKSGIGCLATDGNVSNLSAMVTHFHERYGEKSFGISFPHYTAGRRFSVDITRYTKQMTSIFDYAFSNGIYVDQIAKLLAPLVREEFRLCACKIMGGQQTFYPSGDMTLCTKIDTRQSDFTWFLRDPMAFAPLFAKQCEKCIALSICGGGCVWDAHFDVGPYDSRNCYFNQSMMKVILWHMYDRMPRNVVFSEDAAARLYASMIGEE